MPINGIVQGMQPIIGFNYGSDSIERVIQTFKFCVYIATTIAILAWIGIMAVPGYRGYVPGSGQGEKSLCTIYLQNVLFLLPLIFTLPHFLGIIGVWLSFALADGCAFFLTIFILIQDRHILFAYNEGRNAVESGVPR